MSKKAMRCWLLGIVGLALLHSPSPVAAQPKKGNEVVVKRFTGLLTDSGYFNASGTPVIQNTIGQPLSKKADWIDFICDPRTVNWKIQVNDPHTAYLNNPKICDHVEVMMFYYSPQRSFPETGLVDGKAIYIKRIP